MINRILKALTPQPSFLSLFAIDKLADPPKTGSDILNGKGRVFSLNPSNGRITKKCAN